MLATFSAALQVKKRMAKRVLKMSGVHGIGVGYRDPAHPKKGSRCHCVHGPFSVGLYWTPVGHRIRKENERSSPNCKDWKDQSQCYGLQNAHTPGHRRLQCRDD